MPDFATRITALVDTEAPPVDIDALIRQLESGSEIAGTPPDRRLRRTTNWVVAVGAAIVVFVLVGGFAWLIGGTGSGVIDEPPSTTAATSSTTSPGSTTVATVATEAAGWNTVLADTRAKVPPASATCSPSATPSLPGPSDQARPEARWIGNLAGAFDRRTGRVVYVDVTGETWTFDVCTNIWHKMNPRSRPVPDENLYDAAGQPSGALGQLVYDIDSDLTISIGYGGVSVYDANTNTWSKRADPPEGIGPLGAVYDPISGLVITSINRGGEDWDLWAYDVGTDTWTLVGTVTVDRDTPCCTQIDLLGYANDIDRLVLVTYYRGGATLLVDPRAGEMTIIADAEAPVVDLGWPNHAYGQANDTVYVHDQTQSTLLGFDANALAWTSHDAPAELPSEYVGFAATVDDPINHRIILINGIHGDRWAEATVDIWAVNLTTGEWTQILAPATPE